MREKIFFGLTVFLTACALGCNSIHETVSAARQVPRRANLKFSTPEMAAGLKPLTPILSPSREFFRSPDGVWGKGRRMGPLWTYDPPAGAALDGLAMLSPTQMAILESPTQGGMERVLRYLDADGQAISSRSLSGFFTSLDAGLLGGRPVLLAKGRDFLRIIAADGKPVWKEDVAANEALLVDLDGDGRGALVIGSGVRGTVAAFAADGRRLWMREGLGEIYGLAGTSKFVAVFSSAGVVILNGKGHATMSFKDETMPERGVFLSPQGSAVLLAHVGSNSGMSRERLRISRIDGLTRTVMAEAEIGPTRVVAMIAPDLNGDGRKDLALGTENGWVFLYDEHAQFWGEKRHFGQVPHLAAGDINGDDWDELIVGMRGNSSRVYAYGAVSQAPPNL